MHKYLTVTASDGSVWGVPVGMIAVHRAAHYASEFGGDVQRSLAEDTLPLFAANSYEIEDWAVNQMNWSDFRGHHVKIAEAPQPNMQDAWMSGAKGFADECLP